MPCTCIYIPTYLSKKVKSRRDAVVTRHSVELTQTCSTNHRNYTHHDHLWNETIHLCNMTHHTDPFMVCHDTYMDAKHHKPRTYHLWNRRCHHTFTPIHGSVVVICGVWVGFKTSLRLYRAILHSNSIGATLYELIWGYT